MTNPIARTTLLLGVLAAFATARLDAQSYDPAAIAAKVADGIGTVIGTRADTGGTVFVFEEVHTSRLGRLQTALMLLRLYRDHGVRVFGLEGAMQRSTPLDTRWFHALGGDSARSKREAVAVRMLGEGEINPLELMTLLYPDARVHGMEIPKEYERELSIRTDPRLPYLYAIGLKSLSHDDTVAVATLVQQGKRQAVPDWVFTNVNWVKDYYPRVTDTSVVCLEQSLEMVRAIQAKARGLRVLAPARDRMDMDSLASFFSVANIRSVTMADYTVGLARAHRAAPVAILVGAAHSCGVRDRLAERGLAIAELRPIAFSPDSVSLTGEQFDRKGHGQWARVRRGQLGGLLNPISAAAGGRRNPPPVIESATGHGYASLTLAALLVTEAQSGGKPIDDAIRRLASAPDFRIDKTSIVHDGNDVIFRSLLMGTDGKQRSVWTRVGTTGSATATPDVMERLTKAIADMGGSGSIPPSERSSAVRPEGREGPGDSVRDNGSSRPVVLNKLDANVLAVYTRTKDDAVRIGRIS